MPEPLSIRPLLCGVILLLVAGACSPGESPGSDTEQPSEAASTRAVLPEPDPVSVAPVLEEQAAASAVLNAEGGTIETAGPDGIRFTLEIPAGVLLTEIELTLTPARAVEELPLSGDLVGAVDLAPDGLLLLRPATLVIESPDLPDEVLAFGWLGDGDDFHLKVFEAEEGRVEIPVTHFSGAGAGGGTAADAHRASEHPPFDPDAAYENAMAACQASGRSDCRDSLREYVLAEYHGRVKPMLEAAVRDENQPFRDGIRAWLAWWARLTLVLGGEGLGTEEFLESQRLAGEAFDHAYRRAKERCVTDHDPSQGQVMLQLGSAQALLGFGDLPALDDFTRCVRFTLDFRNEIDITSSLGAIRDEVLARSVPITFEGGETRTIEVEGIGPVTILGGAGGLAWGGVGEISLVEVDRQPLGGLAAGGTVEYEPSQPDRFSVDSLSLSQPEAPANALDPWEEEEFSVELRYDPGRPDATATFEGVTFSLDEEEIGWRDFYDILHQEDLNGLDRYVLTDWEPGSGQDLFAEADVERSLTEGPVSGTSSSIFELWHEPDPALAREG